MLSNYPTYDRAGFTTRDVNERDWVHNEFPDMEALDEVIIVCRLVIPPFPTIVYDTSRIELITKVHTSDGQCIDIPKVVFDEESHTYELQDYVYTPENCTLTIMRFPKRIVSGSAVWDHVREKPKANWGSGGFNGTWTEVIQQTLVEHFCTLKKPLTYAERYKRMDAIQKNVLKIKDPKRFLPYVDTRAILAMENMALEIQYPSDEQASFMAHTLSFFHPCPPRLHEERPLLARYIEEECELFKSQGHKLIPEVNFNRAAQHGNQFHQYMEHALCPNRFSKEILTKDMECDEDMATAELLVTEFFENGIQSYQDWDVLDVEVSMGSFKHKICGRMDLLIGRKDAGQVAVMDYKRADGLVLELEEMLESGRVVQGEFSPNSPLKDLPIPESRKWYVKEATLSSITYKYAIQQGVYRKLLILNGYDTIPYVYLIVVHPSMGENYIVLELPLLELKAVKQKEDDLCIAERVDLAFQKRMEVELKQC